MSDEPVLATRDEFLSGSVDRRYRNVTLPISGKVVRIQSLSELERARYEAAMYDGNGRRIAARVRDVRARLICLCMVDARGDRLLNDTDAERIVSLDSHDVGCLYDAMWEHVGFGNQGVDEAVKN